VEPSHERSLGRSGAGPSSSLHDKESPVLLPFALAGYGIIGILVIILLIILIIYFLRRT